MKHFIHFSHFNYVKRDEMVEMVKIFIRFNCFNQFNQFNHLTMDETVEIDGIFALRLPGKPEAFKIVKMDENFIVFQPFQLLYFKTDEMVEIKWC